MRHAGCFAQYGMNVGPGGRAGIAAVTAVAAWFGFASVAGCGARDRSPETPTGATSLTSGDVASASRDDAIGRIATARCERALACNTIGRGELYEDQTTCLATTGLEIEREIGDEKCPRGVHRAAAVRCLLEVRQQPCGEDVEWPPGEDRGDADPSDERGRDHGKTALVSRAPETPLACRRARLCSP